MYKPKVAFEIMMTKIILLWKYLSVWQKFREPMVMGMDSSMVMWAPCALNLNGKSAVEVIIIFCGLLIKEFENQTSEGKYI